MDVNEESRRLIVALEDASLIFDELFGDISPVDSTQEHVLKGIARFSRYELSLSQLDYVKRLSGLIATSKKSAELCKHLLMEPLNDTESERIRFLENSLRDAEKLESKQEQRVLLLQEYLVHELRRAEELENKLREKESELVSAEDKIDKLNKRLSHGDQNGNGKRLRTDDPTDDFIGSFVRKRFAESYYFGVVVKFDAPYYRVSTMKLLLLLV